MNPIKMHEPKTLVNICRLARLAEDTLAANSRAQEHTSTIGYSSDRRSPYERQSIRNNPYQAVTLAARLALPVTTNSMAPRNRRTICPTKM